MKAALVISHGSRSSKTKQEVAQLVTRLQKRSRVPIWEFAFLEIESPSIPEGIETCLKKGADEVAILLNFLNSGKHVDEDIPRFIRQASKKYPGIRFHLSPPVGQHPKMADLFLKMLTGQK